MKRKNICNLLTVLAVSSCLLSCNNNVDTSNNMDSDNVYEKMNTNNQTINLSYPNNNQVVTILKPAVLDYVLAMKEQAKGIENDYVINDLNGNNVHIKDYYRELYHDDRAKKIPLIFDASNFGDNQIFTVKISTNNDLSNPIVINTKESFVTIDNLFANTTYYWQVSANNIYSEIRSFKTDNNTRMITADYVANIRDIGGHEVKGGKVIKQGLIYRGGELTYNTYTDENNGDKHYKTLTDEAIDVLVNDLNIGMEIDFRGPSESNYQVDSDLKTYGNADVSYYRYSIGSYGDLISSTSYRNELRTIFNAFANANTTHVYYHCWGGADRTGTVGFLLGGLLGMKYSDLVIDYELTSFARNFRQHDAVGPYWDFPSIISSLIASPYYQEGKELSLIIEDWMKGSLSMSQNEIDALKTNLLEDK